MATRSTSSRKTTRKSAAKRPAAPPARKRASKRAAPRAAKPAAKRARSAKAAGPAPHKASVRSGAAMPDFATLAKRAKLVTPEQAIDLYKANARMALDVINAAIESAARVRKLQFDGASEARAFGARQLRNATDAKSPEALVAAGQGAAREAIEHAMGYWSQMFDLIVEIQKRLFTLIEDQMAGVPGVKEARAAMAMMPDMSQAQNVIRALQGVVSSSGGAVEQMQKVMGDLARMGDLRRP
jgi:phasin family protein